MIKKFRFEGVKKRRNASLRLLCVKRFVVNFPCEALSGLAPLFLMSLPQIASRQR